MKWLGSIARVAGVSSPFTAWLVQIAAERSVAELDARLKSLEDPISMLHEDVPAASEAIYARLRIAESNSIDLDKADYVRFSRALAVLDANGHISGKHGIGALYAAGLRVTDPAFILYMCSLYEDSDKLDRLVEIVNGCTRGQSLRAQEVMNETGLPNAVVAAVFKTYESKGYGMCSQGIGLNQAYYGKA